MKIYKIKVNGKTFRVELESVEEVKGSGEEKKVEAKAETKVAAPAVSSGEGNKCLSPIAGTVVAVKIKVGDVVKKGQPIAVVEAMKLENDVVSEFAGTVTEVRVAKGNTIQAKDVIALVK